MGAYDANSNVYNIYAEYLRRSYPFQFGLQRLYLKETWKQFI